MPLETQLKQQHILAEAWCWLGGWRLRTWWKKGAVIFPYLTGQGSKIHLKADRFSTFFLGRVSPGWTCGWRPRRLGRSCASPSYSSRSSTAPENMGTNREMKGSRRAKPQRVFAHASTFLNVFNSLVRGHSVGSGDEVKHRMWQEKIRGGGGGGGGRKGMKAQTDWWMTDWTGKAMQIETVLSLIRDFNRIIMIHAGLWNKRKFPSLLYKSIIIFNSTQTAMGKG